MSDISEIMAVLSDNYKIGIGVSTGIVVIIYALISIFSIRRVYKVKGKVTAWGMIPIVHIFLFLTGVKLPEKKVKIKKEETDGASLKKENDSSVDPDDIPLDDIGDIF